MSANAQQQLLAAGVTAPNGVVVIHNGVDVSRFTISAPTPQRSGRIVHVGRLYHVKGQDTLVDAMATVHRDLPEARLTIVGDGPTRSALEAQSDRLGLQAVIRFEGKQDDVRPFLAAASLFVLPSRSEGISIALLEAMASGLPVVATDVGGNSEVLDTTMGVLVPPESPSALAESIVTLLSNPESAAQSGRNARNRIEADFSLAATGAAYDQAYGSR